MIYEGVITTVNDDGTPHITPMGYREQGEFIVVAPFRPSRTLDNLQRTKEAVINMTDNVGVIAGCLTGRYDWPTVAAEKVKGIRLKDTLAHMELILDHEESDELRPKFYCTVEHQKIHSAFKGFNRAKAAVLEGAILVSRLHMIPKQKIDEELAYLQIAIDKTAGKDELQAWEWLLEKVQNFRDQNHNEPGI